MQSPRFTVCRSPKQTSALAGALAAASMATRGVAPGLCIALRGELGAGKTHFAKGFAAGCGVDPDEVTSPTFTLLNAYRPTSTGWPLYHLDAYRLADASEFETAGLDHLLAGDGVALLEWPERVEPYLPADRLELRFSDAPPNGAGILEAAGVSAAATTRWITAVRWPAALEADIVRLFPSPIPGATHAAGR